MDLNLTVAAQLRKTKHNGFPPEARNDEDAYYAFHGSAAFPSWAQLIGWLVQLRGVAAAIQRSVLTAGVKSRGAPFGWAKRGTRFRVQ